ncbi:DsrE family protein [Lacticaseibacillus zhaodongensis]|uniref:DsrE family protein n=1 Tax=Lacticaseibacillus zhaodongensis TaxID=2668065 RepID=UPI0012D35FAF|nr:DsrE family protein [Lacticaseibacillus zhaodongensis]
MNDVIFHIDESAKWPTLLSNVQHYREWLRSQNDASALEVLVNGAAVADTTVGSAVDLSALAQMATVAVCANSMSQRQITRNQLQAGLTVVPAGVVELAQRQHQGYAYIKP